MLLLALAVISNNGSASADSALVKQGIKEFNAGEYENAVGHLGAALSTDFNDARLHYYLGSSYVHLKQPESATREFRIAYALEPTTEVGKFAHKALVALGAEKDTPAGGPGQPSVLSMFVVTPPKVPAWNGPIDYKDPNFMAWLKMAQAASRGWNMLTPTNGADHSDQVPAMTTAWRPRAKFNDSNLPDCTGDGLWFKVPEWLEGSWAPSGTKIESSRQEYEKNSVMISQMPVARPAHAEIWGMAKDPEGGQVWQHVVVPSIIDRQIGKSRLVDVCVKIQPVELSTEKVLLFHRGISFVIVNNVIQSTTQYEAILEYLPLGHGYCQLNESVKEFDELGMPLRILKYRSYLKLSQQLKLPRTGPNGENYQAMLNKFLTGH
jgi:hypothetical protein